MSPERPRLSEKTHHSLPSSLLMRASLVGVLMVSGMRGECASSSQIQKEKDTSYETEKNAISPTALIEYLIEKNELKEYSVLLEQFRKSIDVFLGLKKEGKMTKELRVMLNNRLTSMREYLGKLKAANQSQLLNVEITKVENAITMLEILTQSKD